MRTNNISGNIIICEKAIYLKKPSKEKKKKIINNQRLE